VTEALVAGSSELTTFLYTLLMARGGEKGSMRRTENEREGAEMECYGGLDVSICCF